MKVLMVGPIEKAGGVSTHTKELTKALRKWGLDVEVYNISPDRDYPPFVSRLIKLYKRTLGLSWILLKDSGKFDLVHIQASGPMGGFIPAITATLFKKLLKFKLVVTFHYSNTPKFVKNHRKSFAFVLRNSDKFIVVSNAQREVISSVLGDRDKIVVVPNGYNPNRISQFPKKYARNRLGLSDQDRILLNVALLLEKKGQRYLIEAMNRIVNVHDQKNVKCFIIGAGPLRDSLQKMIDNFNLQDHVKLLGFVPDEELALWMNAADVFVLPSLRESFGLVVLEALAVGTPVVATINGGSEEVVTSEDYGLLCPPADPECLAEKILIALEKDWDMEKIRKYAEQFTWERIAKKIITIYKKVLGGYR